MISIIHPSRGRPKQSFETINQWIQRADSKFIEVILCLDLDDPQLQKYRDYYQDIYLFCTWHVEPNKSSVEAINRGARVARGDIMMVVSDDQHCPINWYRKIIRYTTGHEDFVLKVKDGFQNRIITMPIFDRKYYNRDGHVYNPMFEHLFSDTYYTDLANKRQRVISKNITFPHKQYSIIGTEPDEISKKNNRTYGSGKKTYLELKKTI